MTLLQDGAPDIPLRLPDQLAHVLSTGNRTGPSLTLWVGFRLSPSSLVVVVVVVPQTPELR